MTFKFNNRFNFLFIDPNSSPYIPVFLEILSTLFGTGWSKETYQGATKIKSILNKLVQSQTHLKIAVDIIIMF